MRRLVSLLLIPLLLTGQCMCHAHTHRGTPVAEPEGHLSRPHFHLYAGDGRHHHHAGHTHQHEGADDPRDESSGTIVEPILDHDADAVYSSGMETLSTGSQGRSGVSAGVSVVGDFVHTPATRSAAEVGILPCAGSWSQPPPLGGSRCPIYLRTLSLRV